MLNLKPTLTAEDTRYLAAFSLVAQIEAHLAYGRPLIAKNGQRLTTLEDAVRAILSDNFQDSVGMQTSNQEISHVT